MLKRIMDMYRNHKKEKQVQEILDELEINNSFGLTINGLVVSEFNYLFTYILREINVEEFYLDIDNFEKIAETSNTILAAIDHELNKDQLREQISLNISKETAIHNMKNLKNIIGTITIFIERIKQLN